MRLTYVKAIRQRAWAQETKHLAWCCCSNKDKSSRAVGGGALRWAGVMHAQLSWQEEALKDGCNDLGWINLSQDWWAAIAGLPAKMFFTVDHRETFFFFFLMGWCFWFVCLQNNYVGRRGNKKCVGRSKHTSTWKRWRKKKRHFLRGSIICTNIEVIISMLLISWALILLLRICSSHTAIQKSCFWPSTSPDIITSLDWTQV